MNIRLLAFCLLSLAFELGAQTCGRLTINPVSGQLDCIGPVGAGTGTVTSVGWAGGIVSVGTATTTPTLTVAGTSGGIVYFSSSSAWASSGVLGAGLPIFGGGAGAAPVAGTVQGNTSKVVTYAGSAPATNDCAKFDANGNLTTNGSACGSGGGGTAGAVSNTFASSATTVTVTDNLGTVTKSVSCAIGTAPNYVPFLPNTIQYNTNTTVIGFTAAPGAGLCTVSSGGSGTGMTSLTGDATGSGSGAVAVTVVKINGVTMSGLATGILKNTTGTGAPSIAVAGDFPTLNQNTTGSAATLTTPRAIYGNNFDGSAALTQIIASTFGGTGNGFTKFTGPATAERTFTLPNADATLVYSGGPGGTPSSLTLTNAIGLPFSAITTGSNTTAALTIGAGGSLIASAGIFRVPNGTTLPGTCTVGDSFMDTDATSGARWFLCQSTNTWAVQGSAGTLAAQVAGVAVSSYATLNFVAGTGITPSGTDDSGNSRTNITMSLDTSYLNSNYQALDAALTALAAGSDFVQFTGPTTSTKVFTLPNATATILTTNAAVTVAQGGTGVATITGIVKGNGTSAFSAATAGTDFTTPSSTESFTNKTIDAEGTGNTITTTSKAFMPFVGCASTTGTVMWDTLASLAPTATCSAGTTETLMMRGTLDFPDSDGLYSVQQTLMLPADFTGAIDVRGKWKAAATSGDVVWQVSTACRADAEVDDVAWNTASTVTETAKGTTLQLNDWAITGITATGCAAGEFLHLRVARDRTNGSDTITGVVSLAGGLEMTTRRAQ